MARNDDGMAALVTARHVVAGQLRDGHLDAAGSANFSDGRTVNLSGSRVLEAMAPGVVGHEPVLLDAVVVLLEPGQRFPAPPVPFALLDEADGEVEGSNECTLLHCPDDLADTVVVTPSGRLTPYSGDQAYGPPPWLTHHTAVSASGSSGGMLVDHQCRAFAVHVHRVRHAGVKGAVLLGVLHAALGPSRSPWTGIGPVVDEECVVQLPLRNHAFVGRVVALSGLTQLVQERGQAMVVSTGLPGVGKSSLVLEWAHQRRSSGMYAAVWWIRADELSNASADLLELGTKLGLSLKVVANRPGAEQARYVVLKLPSLIKSGLLLLVFDNVQAYDALKPLVPTASRCRTVFTARSTEHFPPECVMPLLPFDVTESLLLVQRLMKRSLDEDEQAVAKELCSEVGHLPLAIAQLASHAA